MTDGGKAKVLEAPPAVHRAVGWSTEVTQEHQVLQVIGKVVQDVGVGAVWVAGAAALQRITNFQESARRIVSAVGQGIVHPLANFMRQRRYVLREHTRVGVVVEHRVGLSAIGAVIAADATTARGEIRVGGDENGKRVGLNLRQGEHVGAETYAM